ncbi:hypothetical protein JG32_23925 [Salmonella enterica subsp. enterica serovar Bareilly str. CFSAN000227]|nr:hypothetical protein JG32_23925 [Salmonella enterica subsp. enterica serovar Bareilly str. CFSAN000227]
MNGNQQIFRGDLIDEFVPDIRENIHFQPAPDGHRIMFRPAPVIGVPVHGDLAEGMSVFLFLLSNLLISGRIDPFTHSGACGIT